MGTASDKYTFYILCAKGTHGGPEALHQIARNMMDLGYDVRLVLYQDSRNPEKRFADYNVKYVGLKDIPDREDTILCVTETNSYYLRRFSRVRKIMIWLSLDYYLMRRAEESYTYRERCEKVYINSRFKTKLAYPLLYLRDRLLNRKCYKFDIPNVKHTYNCEYVRRYLEDNGIDNEKMVFLDGPLRKEFFEGRSLPKKDIMAYNPGKGAERLSEILVRELNERYPEIKCVPIKGMSPDEVMNTLLEAKIYVDLGMFPGPEKLVKEACMCDCRIITAKRGAAENDMDILIPEGDKFPAEETSVEGIIDRILRVIKDEETSENELSSYKEKITELNRTFGDTVKRFIAFAESD